MNTLRGSRSSLRSRSVLPPRLPKLRSHDSPRSRSSLLGSYLSHMPGSWWDQAPVRTPRGTKRALGRMRPRFGGPWLRLKQRSRVHKSDSSSFARLSNGSESLVPCADYVRSCEGRQRTFGWCGSLAGRERLCRLPSSSAFQRASVGRRSFSSQRIDGTGYRPTTCRNVAGDTRSREQTKSRRSIRRRIERADPEQQR